MNISLDAIRNGGFLPDFLGKLPKIPVASAISGLVVAALILMTPNPWFEAFIVETGLPGILSAAEPPLGARARIVFALVAALIVTLVAWAALTVIVGRKMRGRAQPLHAATEVDDLDTGETVRTPMLRRADAHPDAPYRRPIMAEDDLGTPLDLVDVQPAEPETPAEDGEALELGEVAQILEDDPVADTVEDVTVEPPSEPLSAGTPAEAIDRDGETTAAPEPVFEIPLPRRDHAEAEAPARPGARPVPAAPPSDARIELAELVARLEAGMERKRERKTAASQAPDNVTAHPQAQPSDDRDAALREALSALQQVAGKAG
ncbi:MAG: hypothetical protein AAGE05_05935 [Pseudomonadota bacterium]